MVTTEKESLKTTNEEVLESQQGIGGVDWLQLLDRVLANWYWIVICAVISLGAAWLYLKKTPNVYQVQSSVLIKDDSNDVFKDQSMMSSRAAFSSVISMTNNFSTEMDILRSRTLIKKVVESLDLYVSLTRTDQFCPMSLYEDAPIKMWMTPEQAQEMGGGSFNIQLHQNGSLSIEGSYGASTAKFGTIQLNPTTFKTMPALINTKYGPISITRVDSVPLKEDMIISASILPPTVAASMYKGSLGVEQSNKESFIASLTFSDTKPLRGIHFINRLVQAYNEDANEDKNQTAEKTAAFINNRIILISNELGNTENTMAGFKRSAGLTNLESDNQQALTGRTRYQESIAESETRLRMIQFMKEHVKNNVKKNEVFPTSIGIANDNGLANLINEYNKAVIERNRMVLNATDKNSVIANADIQLQSMRDNILMTLTSLENGAHITRQRLEQEYGKFASNISQAPEAEKQYLSISRQRDFQSQLYLLLLQKREENAIKLAATANNGRIIESPEAGGAIAPRRGMIKLVALFLGMLFPVVIIYLRMLLAVKVSSHDDVKRISTLPLIGDIPLDKNNNGERRIVVHENTNEIMDEAFRSLRTNIQFMLRSAEKKVIMFTSALSGEGKSTVACNLAASYAFLGMKVVVVGLDIRRPGLNKVFKFSTRLPGISQYLADPDNTDLLSLAITSDVSANLHVIPGGIIPPNPTELVSQDSLEKAIDILRTNYDMIILDTAPVGVVSDSQVISRVADMTIVVVRADYTYKSSVAMIDDMAANKILPNVGLTFNALDFSKKKGYGYRGYGYSRYGYRRYGYNYGYSYGYGYGYGHESTSKKKKGLLDRLRNLF